MATPVTSGLINSNVFDVVGLIEQARKRCGLLPGSINAEEMSQAQNELYFYMSSLINQGILLWTITKQIYGLNVDQYLLPLTSGTVDIRNILYRYNVLPSGGTPFSSAGGNAANAFDQTLLDACTQTSADGYISYDFGQAVIIQTVGLLPQVTGNLNPTYEYSVDNVSWETAILQSSASSSYVAAQWYWLDVPQPTSAQYFRVRETSGGTLNVTQLVFGQPAREVTISRSNADDYQNLPYKIQTGGTGRPLQYWFDRQITPQIWLWPSSGYWTNTLVVWRRRELQDLGTLQNSIEFPNRWLDAVLWNLAARLCYICRGVDPQRLAPIEARAARAEQLAFTEERDDSPVMYQPMIGVYTRGCS